MVGHRIGCWTGCGSSSMTRGRLSCANGREGAIVSRAVFDAEAGSGRRRQDDAVVDFPPAADKNAPAGRPHEGGEPACWAHLVCPECGAVVSEGHRQGCRSDPAELGRRG